MWGKFCLHEKVERKEIEEKEGSFGCKHNKRQCICLVCPSLYSVCHVPVSE